MRLEYEYIQTYRDIRNQIKGCQIDNHMQQVAYSTYHDALTQICFDCMKIRSNIRKNEKE